MESKDVLDAASASAAVHRAEVLREDHKRRWCGLKTRHIATSGHLVISDAISSRFVRLHIWTENTDHGSRLLVYLFTGPDDLHHYLRTTNNNNNKHCYSYYSKLKYTVNWNEFDDLTELD